MLENNLKLLKLCCFILLQWTLIHAIHAQDENEQTSSTTASMEITINRAIEIGELYSVLLLLLLYTISHLHHHHYFQS